MTLMRVKVDTILSYFRFRQSDKVRVRQNLYDLYATLPAERIWLYVKVLRNLPKLNPNDFTADLSELELDGKENEMADCE